MEDRGAWSAIFHGVGRQRSLVGYIPWGCKQSNITERLSIHSRKKDMKMKK